MRRIVRLPALAAIGLIRLYQLTVGKLPPSRCRFSPSCSTYAIEAIDSRGMVRGSAAALWRLVRCGPWTAGGYDPVQTTRRSDEVLNG